MIVFIKISGKDHAIEVKHENTVLYLKYKIQDELHIDVRQQRLIFNGYSMPDEITLQKLGVGEKSKIHLLLSMF